MRQRIRLTEGDLHRIVKESVKRVLRESTRPRRRFGLRENNNRYDYFFSVPNYDYDQDDPWDEEYGVIETSRGLEIYDASNDLVCVLKGKSLSDYKNGPDMAKVDMSNIDDDALIDDMNNCF